MTITSLALAPAAARRHGRHRRTRRPSHAALELRREWRPRRTLGAVVADAAASYLLRVALWAALIVVLAVAFAFDYYAAAYGMAALGTGFFRRRRVDAAPVEQPVERPADRPAAAVAVDERPVGEPADDVDVPELASDDEPAPPERTDHIPVVRREPASVPGHPNPAARIAELERVIAHGREQFRELEARLRAEQLDREEADRAVAALRRALDESRPAPDPRDLGPRLKHVYLLPTHPESNDVRWRRVAQAAIDAVRGLWPIERWPLDVDEHTVAVEQFHPADALAGTPVGGRDAAASPAAALAPGDATSDEAAFASAALDSLSKLIARRALEIRGETWGRLDEVMREHYRMVAADVIEGGWRPPARSWSVGDLAAILTAHEQLQDGSCRCSWAGVAVWHAEHVAEQLIAAGVTR